MRTGTLFMFALLLAGCGTTVVDGITVIQASYDASRAQILARAETELPCAKGELTLRLLTVHVAGDVRRMAVKGCGKDVVYADTGEGFAIETSAPKPER